MILFSIAIIFYVGVLLLYKPAPESLRERPLTFYQNFIAIKGSLFLGTLFLVIFFISSHYSFISIDENIHNIFALNNNWTQNNNLPLQLVSHLFIHLNLIHIVSNVASIGIASVYERRVGTKRFLTVFTIASLSSIPSILFYSSLVSVVGISGGVYGVAAAFFTDHEELSFKEWLYAILAFIFLTIIFSFKDTNQLSNLNIKVDHAGHFLGALGAIAFCRIVKTDKHT